MTAPSAPTPPDGGRLRDGVPESARCGAPCHYGGLSSARKHSRTEFGAFGVCNRVTGGGPCYQHKEPSR